MKNFHSIFDIFFSDTPWLRVYIILSVIIFPSIYIVQSQGIFETLQKSFLTEKFIQAIA